MAGPEWFLGVNEESARGLGGADLSGGRKL